MGAGDETSWFQSAQIGNMIGLRGKKLCGQTDDNPASRFRGFAAIHYAAYFGKAEVLDFLGDEEHTLLTTWPVKLTVPARERSFRFPAGLSYQCILALQGKFGTLKKEIKTRGIVASPVPLASCMALACGLKASRQIQNELFEELKRPQTGESPLRNPLEIALCCGYVEYAEFLLKAAFSTKFCDIANILEFDYSQPRRDVYMMTMALRPNFQEMELVKDAIRKYHSFGFEPEVSMGVNPRKQLSIYDYTQ